MRFSGGSGKYFQALQLLLTIFDFFEHFFSCFYAFSDVVVPSAPAFRLAEFRALTQDQYYPASMVSREHDKS